LQRRLIFKTGNNAKSLLKALDGTNNIKLNFLIYLLPGLKQVRQQQGSELPGHPGIKKQIAKINICSFLFAVVKRKKSVHVLLSSQS